MWVHDSRSFFQSCWLLEMSCGFIPSVFVLLLNSLGFLCAFESSARTGWCFGGVIPILSLVAGNWGTGVGHMA